MQNRIVMRAATTAIATLMLAAAALAVGLLSASTGSASTGGSPAASAAAKKCPAGKVRVKRPGRSSLCAKKCPAGTKRKVSSRGKLSCVKKTTPVSGVPQQPSGNTAGGSYSGDTEQQRPVSFTVDGGQVKNFEAGVNLWCNTMYNNRVTFDAIANVPPLDIGSDGKFSYEGPSDTGNMKISGTVTGNTATGTVGMNRGDTNYSGGQMYYGSCQASDVAWSAKTG